MQTAPAVPAGPSQTRPASHSAPVVQHASPSPLQLGCPAPPALNQAAEFACLKQGCGYQALLGAASELAREVSCGHVALQSG